MYCQALLSFILQCQDVSSTAVNKKWHNAHRYIPKPYHGLKVVAGISARGDIRLRVPYVAFLGITQKISDGYYPVFLYYKAYNKLILAFGLGTKHTGSGWDFAKLGITTPQTIGQYFGGTRRHRRDMIYDNSYVFKAYDLGTIVNDFKNFDVTNNTTYQTEAVTKYDFETKFPFDTDLQDICNLYLSLPGISGASVSGGPSGSVIVSGSTGTTTSVPVTPFNYHRNIILYGPPGTGKTYNAIRYAVAIAEGIDVSTIVKDSYTDRWHVVKNAISTFKSLSEPPSGIDPRIVFTTFHQSLSYEDFIEGIKPKINEDKKSKKKTVYYEKEPGLFKRICDAARGKKENYVLIIDEINRGNVAQIFGELITLIEEDKREGAKNEIRSTLPYSGERFCVPDNLYIIGTMNTADRSVEALDSALRRRFHFVEMMPNSDLITSTSRCDKVFAVINKRISILKDSEHQIGHSYFLEVQNDKDLCNVFRYNIIPLLQEYFFGDIEKMKMVLGEGFFVKEAIDPKTDFPYRSGDIDIPTAVYRLWGKEEWEKCATTPKLFTDARDKMIDG